MKHLVTREEAAFVRAEAADPDRVIGFAPDRIFRPPSRGHDGDDPIGVVESSGRAACRECGETIPEGEAAIVFGFDSYAAPKLARAYLHAAPCRVYPEEGT